MAAQPSDISILGGNEACASIEGWENQTYRYEPPENVESIRILKLLPAESPKAPILCELITQELSKCEPYEAISYTWGEPSNHESLCLRKGCSQDLH
jgi:hypothetical protein